MMFFYCSDAMLLFIYNIALPVFGFGATIAAFGGVTWRKGSQNVFKRITGRGWLSIVCAVAALAVGIHKEILTNATIAAADESHAVEADEMKRRLADSATQVREIQDMLPRVVTAAIYVPSGIAETGIITTPDGQPLLVFGGDRLLYTIPGNYTGGVTLCIGEYSYPLRDSHAEIAVLGGDGPMQVTVLHPPKSRKVPLKASVTHTRSSWTSFFRIPVVSDAVVSMPQAGEHTVKTPAVSAVAIELKRSAPSPSPTVR